MNPIENLIILTSDQIKDLFKAALREMAEEKLFQQQESTEIVHEIMDVKQAAEFLKMKVPTIYTMTCYNQIPFYKRGKRIYFKREELVKWIEEGRKKTRKEIEEEAIRRTHRRGGKR